MDLKVVSELIKLVSESKLTALEVEEKDFRIKLEKNNTKTNNNETGNNREVISKETESYDAKINETSENEIIESEEEDIKEKASAKTVEGAKVIKAPMVGTYYISSSPDSEPFVTKGKKVKKGDTLCIIEAMKLMNEIDSEGDFEILDILVENGSIVEYGQPLFSVK